MTIQPTMWTFTHEGLPWTANARIAPTAISARPIPVFMDCPFRAVSGRRGRKGLAGRPTCSASGRQGLVEQSVLQVAERAGQQPGHMHLRDAEPCPDLGLGEVPVEAH